MLLASLLSALMANLIRIPARHNRNYQVQHRGVPSRTTNEENKTRRRVFVPARRHHAALPPPSPHSSDLKQRGERDKVSTGVGCRRPFCQESGCFQKSTARTALLNINQSEYIKQRGLEASDTPFATLTLPFLDSRGGWWGGKVPGTYRVHGRRLGSNRTCMTTPTPRKPKKVSLRLFVVFNIVVLALPPRCNGLGCSLFIQVPCPTQSDRTQHTAQNLSHPAAETDCVLCSG